MNTFSKIMQKLLSTKEADESNNDICLSCIPARTMAKVATYNFTAAEKTLSFESDHKWLMLLKEDNSEEVEKILESCDPIERQRLVNGRFTSTQEDDDGLQCDPDDYDDPGQLLAQHPWSIAAVYGANKTLEVLYRFGAEATLTQSNGNNVLHLMIRKSSLDRQSEDSMVATYHCILKLLPAENMTKLLQERSSGNFKPLEWAMFLNVYGLAMAMINTPGVYLVQEKHKGALVTRWYDVTDYEVKEKEYGDRDLIYGLLYLRKAEMEGSKTLEILKSPFLKAYIAKKVSVNWPFCFIWFVMRLHFLLLAYAYTLCGRWALPHSLYESVYKYNNTSLLSNLTEHNCLIWYFGYKIMPNSGMKLISFYMFFMSSLILICDFMSFILLFREITQKSYFKIMKILWEGDYVVQYAIYMMQNLLCVSCFFLLFLDEILVLMTQTGYLSTTLRHFLILTALAVNIYGIFMFQPLSDSFGWLVTIMQRLTLDLIQFGLFLVPSLICMTLCQVYLNSISDEKPQGDTFFYFLHNYLLILADKGTLPEKESEKDFGLIFLYSNVRLTLIFASILIANFLIAVFSNSVSEIMKNRLAISTVQKLCVLSKSEKLFRRWPFFEMLHKYQRNKHFDVKDGKLLLKVVTNN